MTCHHSLFHRCSGYLQCTVCCVRDVIRKIRDLKRARFKNCQYRHFDRLSIIHYKRCYDSFPFVVLSCVYDGLITPTMGDASNTLQCWYKRNEHFDVCNKMLYFNVQPAQYIAIYRSNPGKSCNIVHLHGCRFLCVVYGRCGKCTRLHEKLSTYNIHRICKLL